jgi:hypothetical protein
MRKRDSSRIATTIMGFIVSRDDISTNITYKSLAIIAEAIQKAISLHKV